VLKNTLISLPHKMATSKLTLKFSIWSPGIISVMASQGRKRLPGYAHYTCRPSLVNRTLISRRSRQR
jgi:hypothetical protein